MMSQRERIFSLQARHMHIVHGCRLGRGMFAGTRGRQRGETERVAEHLGVQRPGNVALAGRRTMGGPNSSQLFMRCTPHASACLCIPASTNSKVHIQRTQHTKMALTMREFLTGNLKL